MDEEPKQSLVVLAKWAGYRCRWSGRRAMRGSRFPGEPGVATDEHRVRCAILVPFRDVGPIPVRCPETSPRLTESLPYLHVAQWAADALRAEGRKPPDFTAIYREEMQFAIRGPCIGRVTLSNQQRRPTKRQDVADPSAEANDATGFEIRAHHRGSGLQPIKYEHGIAHDDPAIAGAKLARTTPFPPNHAINAPVSVKNRGRLHLLKDPVAASRIDVH